MKLRMICVGLALALSATGCKTGSTTRANYPPAVVQSAPAACPTPAPGVVPPAPIR